MDSKNMFRIFTGWILFFIMTLVAAFFWQQSAARGRQIQELTIQLQKMDYQIETLAKDIAALKHHIIENENIFTEGVVVPPEVAESEQDSQPKETSSP